MEAFLASVQDDQWNIDPARISTWDGLSFRGACDPFHRNIIRGRSDPYPVHIGIVKKYLQLHPDRNRVYIDVGGHIGTTALPYSRLFDHVHVYEPNAATNKYLLENIEKNGCQNITVHKVGVYSKAMSATVVKHHGQNSGCYYIKESSGAGSFPVVRLDDQEFNGRIDFIKLDTEGSELHVLEGAKELIKRHHPLIQVETHQMSSMYFGYGRDKILAFMSELGYECFHEDDSDPFFHYPE